MPPTALTTAKRALRSTIKLQLSKLPADSLKSQSQTCLQTLLSLPEYTAASRLSVFLSMPSKEIDTSAIVEHSLENGMSVYVPYIHRNPPSHPVSSLAASASAPPSLMDMLALSSLDDYRSLQPDSWGIPTIPKETIASRKNALTEEAGLDLIVMPGVAFDESFKRLGHGKGYYDYFLTRYHEAKEEGKMPVLVALALKEQMLGKDEVPVDISDWLVDIIVTGDGRCLRRQG
ncbi:5-formyltetrahydrofolate cyclo-ligase [Trichophaea hybrida]|nr:5-formyltetrahydrofolate cyclo-ligase [Trichophaea hybrida]